jgi:hypothetical protein
MASRTAARNSIQVVGFSAKVCSRTSASTAYGGSPASNLLMVVGHRFERTIKVSRFGQVGGVQQQEILGAKNLPLDYVD